MVKVGFIIFAGMTLAEVEKDFVEQLHLLYASDEAKNLAWLTIEHICKISKSQFWLQKQDYQLSDEQRDTIYNVLDQLKTAEPIQYILTETEFYGLPFRVNKSVLIPRPETEELVDWILKTVKKNPSIAENIHVLDIGTGSGCIPITLKSYLPQASLTAIDISRDALAVATSNAVRNRVDVTFIQDDILNPQSAIQQSSYGIIVSNPPYVLLSEKEQMHANVLDHEPHLALFVPDENALLFYKQIVAFASTHLNNQGLLFLEINENYGQAMIDLLTQNGFVDIELRKDLRGRDRMLKATVG